MYKVVYYVLPMDYLIAKSTGLLLMFFQLTRVILGFSVERRLLGSAIAFRRFACRSDIAHSLVFLCLLSTDN